MSERKKQISVKMELSESELDDILRKTGIAGLTLGELFENFVSDLVGDGNGSDEREYANRYFERCRFGFYLGNTLLRHLLMQEYDPRDYIRDLNYLEVAEANRADAVAHPEKYDEEEISDIDNDIEYWKEELQDMQDGWELKKGSDMEKEVEIIKKWVAEYEELRGE